VNFPKSLKTDVLDLRTKFASIDVKVFQFEDAKVRFRHEGMGIRLQAIESCKTRILFLDNLWKQKVFRLKHII